MRTYKINEEMTDGNWESYLAKTANSILTQMGKDFRVKKGETEKRDDDIYIFDGSNLSGLTLGRMGDGWVCLSESFFANVWEK